MAETLAKPQVITHIEKSLDYTLFDAKWVPCSAKFAVLGSRARGTGIVQIYEITSGDIKLVKTIDRPNPFKCGTFKASSLRDRFLATGDFKVGFLAVESVVARRRADTGWDRITRFSALALAAERGMKSSFI